VAVSTVKQVMKRFCVGHSTLYKLMAKGLFPKCRKIGRKSVWTDKDLDRFEEALPFAREVKKPKLAILKPEAQQSAREEEEEIELPASLQQ